MLTQGAFPVSNFPLNTGGNTWNERQQSRTNLLPGVVQQVIELRKSRGASHSEQIVRGVQFGRIKIAQIDVHGILDGGESQFRAMGPSCCEEWDVGLGCNFHLTSFNIDRPSRGNFLLSPCAYNILNIFIGSRFDVEYE